MRTTSTLFFVARWWTCSTRPMRSDGVGESGTPRSLGRPGVLLALAVGGVDAQQPIRKFRERDVPASRRTTTPALDFLRNLSRDLLMPLAKRAIINRVKKACLGGVLGPKTPPLAFDDVAAAGHRRLLQLPARRIGTEAALAVFDDLAWELPRPEEFAVFDPRIPAPARHARAPLVKLHRQHQVDEIAAVRIEDVPGDIPLVQSLHDDDLGRRRGIGLAGGQCFVVGPDRLLALDVALGLLD